MNQFKLYLELGFQHISDINGIDHMLFIAALCLKYNWKQWKTLLWLVTAFTVGHSLTLALSVWNVVDIPVKYIEFLIPVTILATALTNVLAVKEKKQNRWSLIYFFTLFFGLIHGLGFSNYLKSLLGKETSILLPLGAFNIGLEIGQLFIVLALLIISSITLGIFRIQKQSYFTWISGGISFLAIEMIIQRFPW
ncbi:MAG: HupE/UreJ family protein [Chitinophagaceae bacterium]